MGKKSSNNLKRFAIGATVAAAAGYLAGILTAPKSGKQTRGDIAKTAKKTVGEAEEELKKLQEEIEGLVADVKGKGSEVSGKTSKEVGELLDKAKLSKDKASELLSALKNGEAEDKELQRAITEATKAINHVRKYLKK